MKTTNRFQWATVSIILLIFLAQNVFAQEPPDVRGDLLDSWSFYDPNFWTDDFGESPNSFTNITSSMLGDGYSLVVDTNVPALLNYPIYITDKPAATITNLVADGGAGSVSFWFGPNWATMNGGPGDWAQLIDVGEWASDASYGYWGLSIDPSGSNILFLAQDGAGDNYSLFAPISWTTNFFHAITLTYSSTNVSLYLDGQLATNDPGGLSVWPPDNVLSGGVYFGSDTNGNYQAHGLFNTIQTYNFVLDSNTVQEIYTSQALYYYINPINVAMALTSAPSNPAGNFLFTNSIIPDVITGPGNLTNDGVASNCSYSTNPYTVWFTNVSATLTANKTMNVTFSIDGGTNGWMYDVFASSVLATPLASVTWSWMGQGAACYTYTLTNIPSSAAFLVLGTPQDSDGDGLTDAYELLVSKSNPTNFSSDGTGMADGWEFLYFGHTSISPNGDPDGDGLTTFQEWQMRSQGYNPVQWNTFTNTIVGDGFQNFSGDGLANLMQISFGGSMFTNNPNWKVNTAGDGMPDEYKVMVGLSPTTAQPAPGLPAYSKIPIP